MRLTKQNPSGTASYLADGVSPASPMLTDGHTSFTPGISEYSTALGSRFYVADAQGNSRGLLDGTQAATDGYNWDAFGISMSRFGSNPTPLAWGEESGYQTDNDSGLKLLGHRYYDSRTGRFISQDPAGAGSNWYAYAYNDPMDRTDPLGLDAPFGDFGLRPGDQYEVDPISAARAGLNRQINQSGGLIDQYQYFSVDKVTTTHWGTADGKVTKTTVTVEHLFDFAVPNGTSFLGNFNAATSFEARQNGMPWITSKGKDALYVLHHLANKTVGDFKDKNFPGIGQPTRRTRLFDLADNGGNMNAGMVQQGLGMNTWEISLGGDVHKSWMDRTIERDDPMGAGVLQVGFWYAHQMTWGASSP